MSKYGSRFASLVRRQLAESPLGELLKQRPAVVLERIARSLSLAECQNRILEIFERTRERCRSASSSPTAITAMRWSSTA